jgi:hypothetical protein
VEDCGKQYPDYIEELEGYQLKQELIFLKTTKDIFSGNFRNFCYVLDMYEHEDGITFLEKPHKLNETGLEILRSFHNYLSSCFTLKNHTCRFRDYLNSEKINIFYDNEFEKIKNLDEVVIIKGLRNYVQHKSLPASILRINFEEKNKFYLQVQEILTDKRLSSESRECLNKFNDKLEVKPLCTKYYENIIKFNDTFSKYVSKEYEKELNEPDDFIKHLKELYYPSSDKHSSTL